MGVALHLHNEMARNPVRVSVDTRYGPVVGGRAANEAVIFLGNLVFVVLLAMACVLIFNFQKSHMPCLQKDLKILSLYQTIIDTKSRNTFTSLDVSMSSFFISFFDFQYLDAAQPSNDGQAQGKVWFKVLEAVFSSFSMEATPSKIK